MFAALERDKLQRMHLWRHPNNPLSRPNEPEWGHLSSHISAWHFLLLSRTRRSRIQFDRISPFLNDNKFFLQKLPKYLYDDAGDYFEKCNLFK